MVIKSLSRKANPGQLISYLLRYSMKDNLPMQEQEQATIILRRHLRTRSIAGYIKEFKANESLRLIKRKDSVILFHTILSFAPENKHLITDDILKDIAKKFVALRSSDCLNLVVAHKEKLHMHLHIATSGIKVNGYSSRVSKQEFKRIINDMERYQQEKYPELEKSLITHFPSKSLSKEKQIEKVIQSRQTQKESILSFIEKEKANCTSKDDLLQKLKDAQYEPYYRNGEVQGIISAGKKFRFSRLGVDLSDISSTEKSFDNEQDILSSLHALRKGKKRRKEQEKQAIEQPLQEQVVNDEQSEINTLCSIRERSKKIERCMGEKGTPGMTMSLFDLLDKPGESLSADIDGESVSLFETEEAV